MKVARITPIYKKGETCDPGNYRPIASLPFISKVYERSMANRLISFFDRFSIISPSQFGFHRHKSTTDAIEHLLEFIYSNLNNKKTTVDILIDLRKAFDTVNHGILLKKLIKLGIRGLPLKWFESYLANRKQFVSVGSKTSTLRTIKIGVPQGSIMGPILFLLFMNDLPNCTQNSMSTLFADDTTLSIADANYDTLVPMVNEEVANVHKWIRENRLTVNIDKTELMLISNKSTNHNNNKVLFDGNYLKFTDCSMFLGLKLDNNLNFSKHIDYIGGKVAKNIWLFSKIRHNLPEKARLNYYYSRIFPYLSQNIIVWGKASACYLEPLVILQKRMICLITNSEFLEHTDPLFSKLKILKLHDIYIYFISIYMHKCLKNGEYQPAHHRNTRYQGQAQPVFQRLAQGQQSVPYMGPTTWNTLPSYLKSITNPITFKTKLKNYLLSQYNMT